MTRDRLILLRILAMLALNFLSHSALAETRMQTPALPAVSVPAPVTTEFGGIAA